jgi:hypothetical protein
VAFELCGSTRREAWFRATPFQTITKPIGVVTLISQKILGSGQIFQQFACSNYVIDVARCQKQPHWPSKRIANGMQFAI